MAGLPPRPPKANSNPLRNELRNTIKTTPYTILGQGAFGAIIDPSLPNMNANGVYSYPNNVTKLYYKEPNVSNVSKYDDFRNTVVRRMHLTENANQNTIHRYSMYPYRHAYSKKNIRSSGVLGQLMNHFQVMDKPHMRRLPNLGYSFLDIVDHPALIEKASNISYKIICQQMLDCMNVVKAIRMDKKIHGDIREMNVMLQPDTGVMTIIDFDFFNPAPIFLEKYSQFFYPHPPECLFVFGYFDGETRQTYQYIWEAFKNGIYSEHEEQDVLVEIFNHSQSDLYDKEDAALGMIEFMDEGDHFTLLTDNNWQLLRESLFNDVASRFIDSYGLAYSFMSLLWECPYAHYNGIWQKEHIYHEDGTIRTNVVPEGEDPSLFRRLREYIIHILLPSMMHANWKKRWTIENAITEFMNTYHAITGEHLRSYNVSGGSQRVRRGIRQTKRGTRGTQRKQRKQRTQGTQRAQGTRRHR